MLLDEAEEKFFWDLVSEPFSRETSSLALAFRRLLKEKAAAVAEAVADELEGGRKDVLEGRPLVGAFGRQRLVAVVVVQDGGDGVAHGALVAPDREQALGSQGKKTCFLP